MLSSDQLYKTLARSMQRHDENVYISHYRMNKESFARLLEILSTNENLKRLYVHHCRLEAHVFEDFSAWLRTHPSLKLLDMQNNELRDTAAKHIAEALEENQTLKYLNLSRNQITDRGMAYFSKMLLKNETLHSFIISKNLLSENCMDALSNTLMLNDSLKTLVLDNNRFKERGILLFCEGIAKNLHLQELSMRNTGISDIGCARLANVIQGHPTLKQVNLSCNYIHDESAESLATLILNDINLLKLDISNNQMTTKGMIALIRALEDNYKLETLDVRGNLINEKIVEEIERLLSRNKLEKKQFSQVKDRIEHEIGIYQQSLTECFEDEFMVQSLIQKNHYDAHSLLGEIDLKIAAIYFDSGELVDGWVLASPLAFRGHSDANLLIAKGFLSASELNPKYKKLYLKLALLFLKHVENGAEKENVLMLAFLKLNNLESKVPWKPDVFTMKSLFGINKVCTIEQFKKAIDIACVLLMQIKVEKQNSLHLLKKVRHLKLLKKLIPLLKPLEFRAICNDMYVRQGLYQVIGDHDVTLIEFMISNPLYFPLCDHLPRMSIEDALHKIRGEKPQDFETLERDLIQQFTSLHQSQIQIELKYYALLRAFLQKDKRIQPDVMMALQKIHKKSTSLLEKSIDSFECVIYFLESQKLDLYSRDFLIDLLISIWDIEGPTNLELLLSALREKIQAVYESGHKMITHWQMVRLENAFADRTTSFDIRELLHQYQQKKSLHAVHMALPDERFIVLQTFLKQEAQNDPEFDAFISREFHFLLNRPLTKVI